MEIIRGKLNTAQKVIIYGPEGIGKTTFASQFPNPLFIDTEGSTKNIDVARMQKPSSWTMLLEQIRYVKANTTICKTLVVDTIDWAEQMCVESICAVHNKKGIEDFGYGNGYIYSKEEFGRFLNLLEDVVDLGIHVVLTAHAQIRKFEQPDEMGAYDRYELKLGKKTGSITSPLVKEWADMVLFANYKTYSIATDDKGKKHKAQGGSRVMYTTHHPCWDAKNRHGLPIELPFEYAAITHLFGERRAPAPQSSLPPVTMLPVTKPVEPAPQDPPPVTVPPVTDKPAVTTPLGDYIPKSLRDLMMENQVDEWDIENVVTARGYYPMGTPIKNYKPEFIEAKLVGKWPQVYAMIKEMKEKEHIPFN